MIKKIYFLFISVSVLIFSYTVTNFYLSEKNKKNISKNRTNIESSIVSKNLDLKILSNDTNNVIEYNTGYTNNQNKKPKRNFWNLIK